VNSPQAPPTENHSREQFEEAARNAAAQVGLQLSGSQFNLLWQHFTAVLRQNAVMNLTRITEPAEAAVKHYADSLALAAWARQRNVAVQSLLDVGTGAGFPAVPLSIARPDWRITAIDGTRKKIEFVRRCASELGLTNLRVEHAHAKHWRTSARFDVVTLRAVTKLADAISMCSRFLARAGWLVVYKTGQIQQGEIDTGGAAAANSGLSEIPPFTYELESGGETMSRSLRIYGRR
jgi:16S rRNA (guanine527-N7)-methyltransferase